MEPVRPSQLVSAARVADALVYAVGVAGVIAGGVLWRNDQLPFALVAWVLTFVAGAGLRLVAWLTRGVAQLLDRTDQTASELAAMRAERVADERREGRDPYGRGGWGNYH